MKRRITLLLTFILMMVGSAIAQVTRVSGVVTSSEDGQPVVGASILVKGTTIGTITNIDGKFVLTNIPSSAKTLYASI